MLYYAPWYDAVSQDMTTISEVVPLTGDYYCPCVIPVIEVREPG